MSKFLQTAKHATVAYELENAVLYNNYPLHKFEFAVRIVFNDVTGKNQRKADALTFIVTNVKLPNVNMPVEVMNEYNRSRLNYGRLEFGECQLSLHDVADGKVMNFWKEYYEYFYSDGNGRSFGYSTLLIPDKNRKSYIDSIDIFQFHAGRSNRTTLMNPKIVSFEPGGLAYNDITGLSEITMSFKPEYVTYKTGVGLPDSITEQMKRGAPAESLAQSIAAMLPPPIEQADMDQRIATELTGISAESLKSKFLIDSSSSFDVNVQQPVESVKTTSSSSLDLIGITSGIFKTIGKSNK